MIRLPTRSARFPIAFMLTLCAGIVLTTFWHHPVGAIDNSCDGVEVSQSGLFGFGTKQHCIRPGTGAKEWFKDCPECPEMVVIPAGNFMMGGDRAGNERPIHRVTIAKPFAVARYSITVGEFAAFINDSAYQVPRVCRGERSMTASDFEKMGTAKPATATKYNSRLYSSGNSWSSPGFEQGDRNPVVCVTWEDAKAYVDWLTRKTDKPYRLLTEAEYEYAARAGTTTLYFWGEDVGKNRANCDGCGSQWDENRTAPVGSFAANAFGLHEVHGNAASWVEDCYRENYLNVPVDGSALTSGNCMRVLRGGSWLATPDRVRAAAREAAEPKMGSPRRANTDGIRIARTIAP